jgi:hypothetical protein
MGYSFIVHLNICFLVLGISCEGFNLFLLTSKGVNNIFINELISYQGI